MRIDLFVSPGCSGCPLARKVVDRFAHDHAGVEVHEWDLSRDPGPATGRGIFATPTVLLDGVHILVGVPSASDLGRYRRGSGAVEVDLGAGAPPASSNAPARGARERLLEER